MDGPGYTSASSASAHTATSHRRKLIKKPPTYAYARSSSGFDGGAFDAQSLESKRSSQSLRRAPSAPPARSNPATVSDWQDSDRSHPQLSANSNTLRPVPSPISPQGDFTPANHWAPVPRHPDRLSDSHLRPLSKTAVPDDLIGAPFDGAAILNRIESIKIPSPKAAAPRQFPPQIVKAPTDSRLASPALRTSTSFSAMDSSLNEKSLGGPRAPTDGPSVNPKRYSDDGKDLKPAVLRKKSGFSGFMNSLVGSPKKPVISAPENPVHVTHVGYDSSTGQFTVSSPFSLFLYSLTDSRVCQKNGSGLSTKAEFLKRKGEKTRKLWLISCSSTKRPRRGPQRIRSLRNFIMLVSMPPLRQLQHHRACTRQTIWVCHRTIFHLRTPGFQLSIMKEVLRIPEHHRLFPEARLVRT